jgi:predicted Zn-dependent protease
MIRDVESLAPARLDLAATEAHLREVAGPARRSARAQDAAYLGGVCIRTARLKWYEKITAGTLGPNLSAESRAGIEKNFWFSTAPGAMLEYVNILGQRQGSSFVSEFLAQSFVRQELPDAMRFLTAASARQPIKPEHQLTIAQLELMRGNGAAGCELIARAIAMSPGRYVLRERASIALLSSGYLAEATPHLRRMLELDPGQFFRTVALLKNESARLPRPLDDAMIASEVLPDDPAQLYGFATRYADDQPELKSILLRRAADLMASASPADHTLMVLKADVQLALGQTENGIELLRLALTSDPNDGPVRYRLARLLLDNDQTREAEEHAERLVAGNNRHQPYIDLYDAIQARIREKAGGG